MIKMFKKILCKHVNNVQIIEKGNKTIIEFPDCEYGDIRYYQIDVVKLTCYKCAKEEIKYKRRYV